MKLICMICVAASVISCAGTRDALSTIRGHLVDENGRGVDGCTAIVFVLGVDRPYTRYEQPTDSNFTIGLVNAPGSGEAYLSFSCPGITNRIISSRFDLKQAASSDGVDLGLIRVIR